MSTILDTQLEATSEGLTPFEAAERVREILGDTSRYGVFPPNEGMLAALVEMTRNRQSQSRTAHPSALELIREARAGAMWGYDACE
jgi:hypothetical protein